MTIMISKWGNSIGLRIPDAVAKEIGIAAGTQVNVSTSKGRIVVEPVHYDLASLVKDITPHNRHDGINAGEAVGAEIW